MSRKDDRATNHPRALRLVTEAKGLLHKGKDATEQVLKRARAIKTTIKDLPPYPGND